MKKIFVMSIIVLLTVFTHSKSECSLIMNLEGHSSGIVNISYSPDGKYLVSSSDDKSIKLWLVEDGNCIKTFKGNNAIFSPDGKYLAIGNDNTIKLFSIEDFSYIREIKVGSHLLTFSHDSKLIMTSKALKHTIELWNVEDGNCIKTFKGSNPIFNPDDKLLATRSIFDNNIKIWSVEDGGCIRNLEGHSGGVSSICFSPNGKYLASRSTDNSIKIWQLEDGSCMKAFNVSGYGRSVESVSFISNGKCLASIIVKQTGVKCYQFMKIWRLEDYNCTRTINLRDVKGGICNLKFSPDNEFFAITTFWNNNIKLWNVNNGRCIKTIKGYPDDISPNGIGPIDFSPDGLYIAICSSDVGTIKIWGIHEEVISNLISKLQSLNFKYYNEQMNEINPLFMRKGEFETQEDYNGRIKLEEIEKLKIENLYEEKMQKERKQIKEKLENMLDEIYPPEIVSDVMLGRYDADEEIYKIYINNKVYEFKVLRDIAKNFKDKFSQYKITMQKKYHITNNYELKSEIINIKLEKDDGTVCNIFEKVN